MTANDNNNVAFLAEVFRFLLPRPRRITSVSYTHLDVYKRQVVQRTGGLVAEQQLWVFGQCAGNGHPLLLAAGKLRREVVRCV